LVGRVRSDPALSWRTNGLSICVPVLFAWPNRRWCCWCSCCRCWMRRCHLCRFLCNPVDTTPRLGRSTRSAAPRASGTYVDDSRQWTLSGLHTPATPCRGRRRSCTGRTVPHGGWATSTGLQDSTSPRTSLRWVESSRIGSSRGGVDSFGADFGVMVVEEEAREQ